MMLSRMRCCLLLAMRCCLLLAMRCCFLLSMTLAAGAAAQSAPPAVFPTVSSDSLSKAHVTLPTDLNRDRNLMLLYFKLDQQPDVNAWNGAFDRWRATDPAPGVYNCLVLPRSNFLSRWWQNSSLRSDTQDANRRNTTVPLYVDRTEFLKQLGISSQKQVVVLVTDRQGKVLARADGPPSDESRAAIHNALSPAGTSQP